ncbi:MAG: DUF1800 domain-containing protein [Candidatus Xenobia bacterium]
MKPLRQARNLLLAGMVATGLLAGAARLHAAPSTTTAPAHLTEQQRALHVLNRFAFGPRPGEVERVAQMGPDRWFEQQLHPESIPDVAVDQKLSAFQTLQMSPIQLALAYPLPNQLKKLQAQGQQDTMMQGKPRDILIELSEAKLMRSVDSERQLEEVMTDFWENHFNIFWNKGIDRYLMDDYVQNAIRPHVLGKFKDLVEATAHSPAMMFYLDNWDSSKNPDPNAPPREGKHGPKGLNENYGREIMELHTLGVDGGYTQKDVDEVARCFTGWSLQRPGLKGRNNPHDAGIWVYRPYLHDNGQKVVLGHVIPAGGGERDGEMVIDILVHSPATAHHIALQLCQAFVADNPPASVVNRVAATYMHTDGDIKEMLRTIYHSPEFWNSYQAKIKMPFGLVVSAMRTIGADPQDAKPVLMALNQMGEGLYLCEPPTGYKDQADQWVTSTGLLHRMNFCMALAEGRVRGVAVNLDPLLAPAHTNDLYDDISILGHEVVHDHISDGTVRSLRQAETDPKKGANYKQLVGLLLGSPEFQRH